MLTIFIATRNGSPTLPSVLQAYRGIQPPSSGWKLVVIDNASTDSTRDIVSSFRGSLPLTYMFEGTVGKNAALNTGLSQLEGDLGVFTDDDAYPRRDWLVRLRAAADEKPSYSLFGGAILPRWQIPPPGWLSYVPLGPFFSISSPDLAEGPVDPNKVWGPNMAIRADIFKRGTRFDETIGPCGRDYAMGSETELVLRLARQGHKAWHVESAVVDHFIREFQMEKSWVLRRSVRFGRGMFRLHDSRRLPLPLLAAQLTPRMCKRFALMAAAWLTSNQQALFTAHRELNYTWGWLVEANHMRHCKAGPPVSPSLETSRDLA